SGSKAPAAKAAAKHTATTATSAEKIPESRPFTDADFKDEKVDQQLKGKGIAGTYKGKEGVFKVEGKDLVFTEKGKDTKEVVLNKQLSETKFSPTTIKTGPSINPEAKSQLETALGAQYKAYTNPLGKDAEIFQTKDGVLTMRSADGKSVLRVEVDPETGIGKGHRIIPSKDGKTDRTEYFITQNGEILATQSENKIKIGETEYALPKGTSVNDLASGEVIIFPGSEKKKGAEAKLGGHLFTLTDFDDGTQKSIDTKTKEKADLGGTVYNPKDTKTCKQEQGCFVPAGGTVEKIVDGKLTSYWAEYNYKDSFGDRIGKTPTIEYYEPNGQFSGIRYSDGSSIFALKDKDGKYNGQFEYKSDITQGATRLISKNEKGDWVYADELLDQDQFVDGPINRVDKSSADSLHSSTQGSLATARGVFQSIYALTDEVKSYPAISNLLFGKAGWYKDFFRGQDKYF
ncbi:MAG TPA: hypothetical protein VJB06_02045, partial [archaeon]|nr:hypothetical protein [archaeon]